ncbi:hypothetical protein QMN27_17060 [Enterobacter asburiae]|uniref:hypothetical protein n=1 Tax=Enterobacter asburiae TaxID=61645 RepID=UPI002B2434DF|nr:hypothetical protein [Enterobacter asburiae]MEB2410327.1 hypothetical protein [Enterobacter asburiae]
MEKVTLDFNHQHLSVISDALINLPYRIAAPVIDSINMQIMQQAESEKNDSCKEQLKTDGEK